MDDKKAQDVQELFATEQGLRVLGYLKEFIKPNISQNPKSTLGDVDVYMVMKNEGKRAVWCHIDALINKELGKDKQKVSKR